MKKDKIIEVDHILLILEDALEIVDEQMCKYDNIPMLNSYEKINPEKKEQLIILYQQMQNLWQIEGDSYDLYNKIPNLKKFIKGVINVVKLRTDAYEIKQSLFYKEVFY